MQYTRNIIKRVIHVSNNYNSNENIKYQSQAIYSIEPTQTETKRNVITLSATGQLLAAEDSIRYFRSPLYRDSRNRAFYVYAKHSSIK
jgi:hypothetical protein